MSNGRSTESRQQETQSSLEECHPTGLHPNGNAASNGTADRKLVDRCLAGDDEAWQKLFERFHPRLQKAIRFFLGPDGVDPHRVDEIAGQVWYVLLRRGGCVLDRYCPDQGTPLGDFLVGVAKLEVLHHLRTERRRRSLEAATARIRAIHPDLTAHELPVLLKEFLRALTASERRFIHRETSGVNGHNGHNGHKTTLTPMSTRTRQRRRRIQRKLRSFFSGHGHHDGVPE